MENGKKPISPILLRQIGENDFRVASEKDSKEGIFLKSEFGLTKREYFAGLAMTGLLSKIDPFELTTSEINNIAELSTAMSDELLKQLEK